MPSDSSPGSKPGSPKRRRVIKRGSRVIENSSGSSRRRGSRGRNNSASSTNKKSGGNQRTASSTSKQPGGNQRTASSTIKKSAGNQHADTSQNFSDLGLPLVITQALASQGATHPFPIQAAAIPQAIEGRDILGRGPTGSGKTFTFGVPIITRLQGGASKPKRPRAVVFAPTRELATQIRQRLEPIANAAGQRVLDVVGGVKIQRQLTALARPVDILIATPGRAQDLINQKAISFDDVAIVAVDEADHMADMGFLPQVTKLMDRMPRDAQHLLFSATLDGDVQILVDKYMVDPITFSTGEATATVDRMDHVLAVLNDRDERNAAVIELGQLGLKTVMFMRTKHATDRQAKKLIRNGIQAVALHGNKGQGAREKALDAFSSGDAQVLVATDIAARGIDVAGVELVVHIDPPAEHKAYVHRAGRTARAGAAGTVVTLTFSDTQTDTMKMMKKAGVLPHVVTHDNLVSTAKGLVS